MFTPAAADVPDKAQRIKIYTIPIVAPQNTPLHGAISIKYH
jgi:hypothetical protein